MKKFTIYIFLMLSLLLQGCSFSDPKYINFSEKSSPDFYTKEIYSKLLNDEEYSLELFNTNFYKNVHINKEEDNDIIENFIRSLSKDNYKTDGIIPEEKEPYQLKITFDDSKYVIKIYSNSTVTVSPWDGIYPEDIINIEDVPNRYNLFDFCSHIEHEWKYNQ